MSALPSAKVDEEEVIYISLELIEIKHHDQPLEPVEIQGKITISF